MYYCPQCTYSDVEKKICCGQHGDSMIEVDDRMVPVLRAFRLAGVHTVLSCSGHTNTIKQYKSIVEIPTKAFTEDDLIELCDLMPKQIQFDIGTDQQGYKGLSFKQLVQYTTPVQMEISFAQLRDALQHLPNAVFSWIRDKQKGIKEKDIDFHQILINRTTGNQQYSTPHWCKIDTNKKRTYAIIQPVSKLDDLLVHVLGDHPDFVGCFVDVKANMLIKQYTNGQYERQEAVKFEPCSEKVEKAILDYWCTVGDTHQCTKLNPNATFLSKRLLYKDEQFTTQNDLLEFLRRHVISTMDPVLKNSRPTYFKFNDLLNAHVTRLCIPKAAFGHFKYHGYLLKDMTTKQCTVTDNTRYPATIMRLCWIDHPYPEIMQLSLSEKTI